MSTTSPSTASTASTLDVSATPAVPFTRLLQVELRKSVDTRAGFWLLMVTAIITGLVMVAVLLVGILGNGATVSFDIFIASTTYTSAFLLPVIGIMLVTSEWSQRAAMTTFTLEPNRLKVVLAKLAAGMVLALIVAAVALAVAALANLIYGLAEGDATWSVGLPELGGFLLTQLFAMATGFALATLLLNTAAAIVVYFAYSLVLPTVLAIAGAFIGWLSDAQPWINFAVAQGPLQQGQMDGEGWAQLLVSGLIWLGIPLGLGMWRVLRAEVK